MHLRTEVASHLRSSYVPGTWKNYKSRWHTHALFCSFYQFKLVPIRMDKLCSFIVFMFRSTKCFGTILGYVSALKVLQQLHGFSIAPFSNFTFTLLLKSLKRNSPQIPQSKLPITPEILLKIYSLINIKNAHHIVYWTSFLLGFYTLFRKSNLVIPSVKTFDPIKHLTRGKIRQTKNGLLIQVTWSKVIQSRGCDIFIPVANVPGSPLSAPFWYKRMCQLIPAPENSPAFVLPTRNGLVPITHQKFISTLRCFLQSIDLSSKQYSGHSFRHGGATFLSKSGFSIQEIMSLGDWSSDSVMRYIKIDQDDRLSLANKFAYSVLSAV